MDHLLSFEIISSIAEKWDLEPCVLDAICRVEARYPCFFPSGQPSIRFEGHIFWKEMRKRGFAEEKLRDLSQLTPNVLYPRREPKFHLEGDREFQRLEEALKINEIAALLATSWGAFQMQGILYIECGFQNVTDFVDAQKKGPIEQLETFCKWMDSRGLIEPLRQKNWAFFARLCYGPSYVEKKYDQKLLRTYEKSCQEHLNK